MSRGLPSMTALLGLLAIAGYQNRDKITEMFRNAGGDPSKTRRCGDPLSGMLGNLGGMLGGAGAGGLLSGGLGELLDKFKQNGEGETAESWINQGPNKEVSPPQLKRAIGADVLAQLAAADRAFAGRTSRQTVARASVRRRQIHPRGPSARRMSGGFSTFHQKDIAQWASSGRSSSASSQA